MTAAVPPLLRVRQPIQTIRRQRRRPLLLGYVVDMVAALVLAVAGTAVLALQRPPIAFSKKARMPAPDSAHTFGVIGIGVAFLVMAAVITSNQ